MAPGTNDGSERIKKYLLENASPEVQNLKDEKPEVKKNEETPKGDANNEYDYSDKETTMDEDAGNW